MKRLFNIYTGLFIAALIIIGLAFSGGTEESNKDGSSMGPMAKDGLTQVVEIPKLKKTYNFAGEDLPMNNFDVRERLKRELIVNSYYHSGTSQNLVKSVRYFPEIEAILREEGLPEDLKYLAVAESNLSNVTSPAGAKGFWQFMVPSAQQFGLEINSEVDERFHLEKATRAACTYFKNLRERFGTWTNAAAAYNVGPTRFAREKERQRMDSYYDMNLNAETGRYIFRVVAIKEVLKHPQDFGFRFDHEEGFPPLDNYKMVKVNTSIPNLGDFAKEQGTTYRMLKIYNPWLISYKLTVSGRKTYEIKIPG
ncbi:MAG TPA: transglycosylase SLT domain-containing protein [Saprospiraceae bacterium]|nr:transglycosylase SLT domain-containing protein [Saprospiraceae bacterium]